MQPGVYEFFGVNYYTHGTGLLLVFPFVVWLFFAVILLLSQLAENFFEKAGKPLKWRSVLIPTAMIPISFVVAFWDVYLIGQQAAKLCKEQAGLHVYKTVETDGFIGTTGIEYWSNYGFKYVEDTYASGEKFRYYILNGKVKAVKIDNFISVYKNIRKRESINNRISVIKECIININSGELLGELLVFSIEVGWADAIFFNYSGFTYSPWICGNNKLNCIDCNLLSYSDIVKSTLKPIKD